MGTVLQSNVSTRNSGGTVGSGVWSVQRSYTHDEVKTKFK
jgi:hypothetical protein